MTIRLLLGAPGCGKTTKIRQEVTDTPGLYLCAFPTIELIGEQMKEFRADAPKLDVLEVHSRSRGHGAVAKRLAEAKAAIEGKGCGHAVILTTHDALLSPNLPDFTGWHIYVDEAINAVRSGTIKRSLDDDLLASNFDLDAVGASGWSELKPRIDSPGWQALAEDDSAKHLLDFYKLAFSGAQVFVRATRWRSVRNLDWFSVWSPLSLGDAGSVTLAGAAFKSSIGFKVWEGSFADRLVFKDEVIAPPRPGAPSVRIHYFTENHEGSTTFWAGSKGRFCLNRVASHLTNHAPTLGYWSGNDDAWKYMEHRTPGVLAQAKAAGLNCYRDHTSCAMIYSSKALPGDKPIQDVFDISDADLLAAREEEDIAQFVYRGAIRKLDFAGSYDVYLYSRRQAEQLRARLISDRVVADAELVPILEAGLMEVVRNAPIVPTSTTLSIEERRERDRLRKKEERTLKAKLNGRPPGRRGRPKKKIA